MKVHPEQFTARKACKSETGSANASFEVLQRPSVLTDVELEAPKQMRVRCLKWGKIKRFKM